MIDYIDLSEVARKAGFKNDVMLSNSVYNDLIRDDDSKFELTKKLMVLSQLKKRADGCRSGDLESGDIMSFTIIGKEIWSVLDSKAENVMAFYVFYPREY